MLYNYDRLSTHAGLMPEGTFAQYVRARAMGRGYRLFGTGNINSLQQPSGYIDDAMRRYRGGQLAVVLAIKGQYSYSVCMKERCHFEAFFLDVVSS